jgi:hypothetical protein
MTPIWTPGAIHQAKGRAGKKVQSVVLHIAEGGEASVVNWFRSPASGVSSHYLVCLDGRVRQFVQEADTAFANGKLNRPHTTSSPVIARWASTPHDPTWPAGLPNLESVSIEMEGFTQNDPTPAQRASVVALMADICQRQSIRPERAYLIGHYQLDSITRLRCPGLTVGQWDALVEEVKAIVDEQNPPPVYNVGPGVTAAMGRQGDTPTSNEDYITDSLSVTSGRNALYLYHPASDSVYRMPKA